MCISRLLIYVIALFFYFSELMAYEESKYRLVKETDVYEIRHYPERLVAQITYSSSINGNGFRKLFNFIDGSNESNIEIKMTVPVTEKIIDKKITMQFFLPKDFTLENTPIPKDNDIIITSIKEGYYAVIKYSGRLSNNNFVKHKDILHEALLNDGIKMSKIPIKAIYNGPYTLPIFRRNEVMYNINWE